MYSEAQKRATEKYQKEKRDRINLNLQLGKKNEWKTQAKEKGYSSLTEYITQLINNDK